MRTGEFVIKEVVNDTIVVIVPKDILSFYKGSEITPKQIMHRLKWIDYSTILVINNEGIEKIINIDNNF